MQRTTVSAPKVVVDLSNDQEDSDSDYDEGSITQRYSSPVILKSNLRKPLPLSRSRERNSDRKVDPVRFVNRTEKIKTEKKKVQSNPLRNYDSDSDGSDDDCDDNESNIRIPNSQEFSQELSLDSDDSKSNSEMLLFSADLQRHERRRGLFENLNKDQAIYGPTVDPSAVDNGSFVSSGGNENKEKSPLAIQWFDEPTPIAHSTTPVSDRSKKKGQGQKKLDVNSQGMHIDRARSVP